MDKRCLLLVCRDTLFKEAMSSLFLNMAEDIEVVESTTHDFELFLKEASQADPDMIVLEEASPLSTESLLLRVLVARPGRPVIVINQENNWMHVVRWDTIKLKSANDLIEVMKST